MGPTDLPGRRQYLTETVRGTRRDAERGLRERIAAVEKELKDLRLQRGQMSTSPVSGRPEQLDGGTDDDFYRDA